MARRERRINIALAYVSAESLKAYADKSPRVIAALPVKAFLQAQPLQSEYSKLFV